MNVSLAYQPSGTNEQRLTYSMYYTANCAKGDVFLQLCGWLGVEHLLVGTTSDTHYQEHTYVFKTQEQFAKNDLIEGEIIVFTVVLDEGYRVKIPTWRAGGKQQISQPIFAK